MDQPLPQQQPGEGAVYGQHPHHNPNHHNRQQHPLANYQFSSDELRVLRECNTESFFQRSLPLGIGFGVTAYFGVQNGYLKPNVRYGAIPKVVLGVVVGYFMGKFSYQQKCAEKLMRLPNSRVGELLRQRRQTGNLNLATDQNLGVGLALSPFVPSGADVYSDETVRDRNRSTALNLDVESRPTFSGLDDTYRPSLDSPTTTFLEPELPVEPTKPGTTYDDLRQKNRDEYLKKQQNPYSRPLPSEAPVIMRQPDVQKPIYENTPNASPHHPKTNKYGDSWTD